MFIRSDVLLISSDDDGDGGGDMLSNWVGHSFKEAPLFSLDLIWKGDDGDVS